MPGSVTTFTYVSDAVYIYIYIYTRSKALDACHLPSVGIIIIVSLLGSQISKQAKRKATIVPHLQVPSLYGPHC